MTTDDLTGSAGFAQDPDAADQAGSRLGLIAADPQLEAELRERIDGVESALREAVKSDYPSMPAASDCVRCWCCWPPSSAILTRRACCRPPSWWS
jgi:hypothetical protein